MKRKEKNEIRVKIYDGTEEVGNCRLSRNLDFWNGNANCNPVRGKHKTISKLVDNRFALIITDDQLRKSKGFVVDNKTALIEILKAKKYEFLTGEKYKILGDIYRCNTDYYDRLALEQAESLNILKRKPEELIIVTKDNFLVEIYSSIPLEVTKINDTEARPDYKLIWSVNKNGIQRSRKL
jgi:hypothetical protein